jgi:hypothetical protein
MDSAFFKLSPQFHRLVGLYQDRSDAYGIFCAILAGGVENNRSAFENALSFDEDKTCRCSK